ncbi:MAG: OmpA family protein [bacterium]|nr:OmpA family protein [bacterium]
MITVNKWVKRILGLGMAIFILNGCGPSKKQLRAIIAEKEMVVTDKLDEIEGCKEELDKKTKQATVLNKDIEMCRQDVEGKTRQITEIEGKAEELAKGRNECLSREEALSQEVEELSQANKILIAKARNLEKDVAKIKGDQLAACRELENENLQIAKEFQEFVARAEMELRQEKRGLVISLLNKIVFDSGKTQIKPEAREVLGKVAEIANRYSNRPLLIEGHTDNIPINTAQFPSNWELSVLRAATILRYLISNHEVNPEQLSAAGYAEYRPVDSNETGEGRERNRRVEIILLPEDFVRKEVELE